LRHGADGFTSPPKEGVLRIFSLIILVDICVIMRLCVIYWFVCVNCFRRSFSNKLLNLMSEIFAFLKLLVLFS